jgi:D-arabinose 1-dehydrogenase-like Zn-dependent alcohol dehydrogenase
MKAAQVPKPGGPFQIVEREIPEPRPGQVRLRIEACGVCHSDFFTKEGRWPGIQYPRIPGHEIAGVIDALGDGVQPWKVGQRVGVGWHGGHCGVCRPCRRGIFVACERLQIPGIVYDGGYAEYVITSSQGLAAIPDALKPEEAAPIMCAGITTFNALRHSGAVPGDLVAVQGIGGLGHLGVQFASKMGFETVAIGRGAEKEEMVSKLGAHHYIDAGLEKPADVLLKLGGAKAILATAPDSKSMGALVEGLGVDGTLMVIGAAMGPMEVNPVSLIGPRRSVRGWPAGTSTDSEDALRLCAISGIRAMIETFPLIRAAAAYDRMMSGSARFRVVLTMQQSGG